MIRGTARELPALLRELADYAEERTVADLAVDQQRGERTAGVARWCHEEVERIVALRETDAVLGQRVYEEVVSSPDRDDFADMGALVRRLIQEENPTS